MRCSHLPVQSSVVGRSHLNDFEARAGRNTLKRHLEAVEHTVHHAHLLTNPDKVNLLSLVHESNFVFLVDYMHDAFRMAEGCGGIDAVRAAVRVDESLRFDAVTSALTPRNC